MKKPSKSTLRNRLDAERLLRQGQLEKAKRIFQRMCDAPKPDPDACTRLATLALQSGDVIACERYCRKALDVEPGTIDASHILSLSLQHQSRIQEAKQVLEEALKLAPTSVPLLFAMANLLVRDEATRQSLPYLDRLLGIEPDHFEALRLQGNARKQEGRYDDALESYRLALRQKPDDELTIAGIASILEVRGETDEADALLQPLIEAGSVNTSILAVFSKVSRKTGKQKQAISLLEERLQNGGLEKDQCINLYFSLGQLYERDEEYDKAFAIIRKANDETRALTPEKVRRFDPDALDNMVDAYIEKHPRQFWEQLPRSTNASERPVFIVGMPRSGTTLMEQILASHSAVAGAGELHDINKLAAGIPSMLGTSLEYPECLKLITSRALDVMAQHYLDRLSAVSKDASRIIDKMPYNFSHVGLISLMFPKARIINMVRNPLDTCLSIYFLKFSAGLPYTSDLTLLGRFYRNFSKLMDYWKQMPGLNILEVSYENLVQQQEAVTREVIDFCGLEWEPGCLSFHETRRDVNTPSYHQVRKPMYTKSIDRWKHYEQHLQPLVEALELRHANDATTSRDQR